MLMTAVGAHIWLLRTPGADVPYARTAATAVQTAPRTEVPAEPAISLEYRDVVPGIVLEQKAAPPSPVTPRIPALGPTRAAFLAVEDVPSAPAGEEAVLAADLPQMALPEPAIGTDAVLPPVLLAVREHPAELVGLPSAPPLPAQPVARRALEVPRAAEATARSARSTPSLEEDLELVRQTVEKYTRAYERLDVRAAKAVWPSLDERELGRAFQGLEAQRIRMSCGRISITGRDANAHCSGDATYHPKVGSRVVRLTEREWTFNLSRSDSGWQIADVRFQ
jgi:hypothetical protein